MKGIEPITVVDEKEFKFDELSFKVSGSKLAFSESESNNSSLVVGMTYKANSFLFAADIENSRIKEFISNNKETYDFIKIPYHGKMQKRLDDLLENVKPKYAVITSSEKEKEAEEVLNILKNLNIKYYLTREGAITVRSNGSYIEINK